MRKIYKYQLENTDIQKLNIPKLIGANNFTDQVLKIDIQNGNPCMWCLVDTEESYQDVSIRIVGTGYTMPLLTKTDYLGSYIQLNGCFVGHVFLEK